MKTPYNTLPSLAGVVFLCASFTAQAENVTAKSVIDTYTQIAHASYSDSLATAKDLKVAIAELVSKPSEEAFANAKNAWKAARVPYGQTEALRFGNPNVDEWEGKVNAWPLDEGLIDYVSTSYEHEDGNSFSKANIIAGKDAITQELLESYHEKGGSEANVATGYHAIEFLLWGQDMNKSPKDSGMRPYTDYAAGESCTNGNCERRAQYLTTATNLLIKDLEEMVAEWAPDADNYRKKFLALEENEALRRILFGMGSLSLGELAGERINVALLAHSQEDEHSCFSDNTPVDIAENARGIQNIYNGAYKRTDGSTLEGKGIKHLVAEKNSTLSQDLTKKFIATQNAAEAVLEASNNGEHFDQQISADNAAGNTRVKAIISALRNQTVDIEASAKALNINDLNPETSDSFGG